MDIKLKSNKESEEFKEKSKTEYKSKGIIAMLLIIAIIVVAALGMCNSYGFVNEAAKGKKVNYFDEYQFATVIAESSYALYYDSIKELENPSDYLLDIKKNIITDSGEYENYAENELNNELNQFNSEVLGWKNGAEFGNLRYYYYNNSNNKTNSTVSGNIKFENGNVNLSELNKDEYQFYAVVTFDNEGNVNIGESFGTNNDYLKVNIESNLSRIRSDYDNTYSDYESGYYNISMNSIKNMTFIYAVPKVISSYDNIRWGMQEADMGAYEAIGLGIAFVIAGIVVLIALVFPIRKARNTILFNKISKIPFEFWIIIIGFAIAALGPLAGQLIRATLNGDLQVIFTEMIPNLIIPERVIWI